MMNLKKIYHKMSIHGLVYHVVIKVGLVIWIIWILYKFVAFNFYKDQVIHPQLFGYNKAINFLPTENYSKIMLTIYKPWNNSIK